MHILCVCALVPLSTQIQIMMMKMMPLFLFIFIKPPALWLNVQRFEPPLTGVSGSGPRAVPWPLDCGRGCGRDFPHRPGQQTDH